MTGAARFIALSALLAVSVWLLALFVAGLLAALPTLLAFGVVYFLWRLIRGEAGME